MNYLSRTQRSEPIEDQPDLATLARGTEETAEAGCAFIDVAADGTVLCEPRSSGGFRFSHPDGGAMTVSTPPWIPARMS